MKLTRYLSLFGEDEPFIQNDDADLEKRAREKKHLQSKQGFCAESPSNHILCGVLAGMKVIKT